MDSLDEELREIFLQEADLRLADLSRNLLELEERGGIPDIVGSLFRDAHTLKGSAATVGFFEVASVAHAMEDVLEGVRQGHREVTPGLVDALLAGVDGIRRLMPSLGRDQSADAAAVTARVRAATDGREPVELESEPERPPAVPLPSEAAHTAPRHDEDTVMVPVSRLDELVRLVGEAAAAQLRVSRALAERLGPDSDLGELRDLSRVLNDLQEKTMRARMVPIWTVTESLRRAVRDAARALGKSVVWEVRGGDTELDRAVLRQLADPLLHLVRNAVDHGIERPEERAALGKPETAVVRLHAMQLGSEVVVTLSDDGAGIDVDQVRERARQAGADVSGITDEEALYLVFRSGLSTAARVTDLSGRGVGLDVVRSSLEAVRGRVELRSQAGAGTEFRLIVPITLVVLPSLLVEAGGERYAIPMHSIVAVQPPPAKELWSEGRRVVWVGEQTVPLSELASLLGGGPAPDGAEGPVVVVAGVTRRHALQVDRLVAQRDVVVKGLGGLLPRIEVVAGASVEPDGSIVLVLDVRGLIRRARSEPHPAVAAGARPDGADTAVEPRTSSGTLGRLLVVDDALTVRELQRSILERAGYEVRVAGDGVDAMALLAGEEVDLVLTDIEMPRMDGLELVQAIRSQPRTANTPVLVLTSRGTDRDRQRGMEAGADGYIVKSAFDEHGLLSAVARLLGKR